MQKWISMALLGLFLLLPCTALADLTIYFLDVEQGDSAVIVCDNEAMIIDGGTSKKSDYIHKFLENHSINRIQYMIATHPHADHIGGLPAVFSIAKVANLYTPVKEYSSDRFSILMHYADENKTKIVVPHKDDKIFLGEATVTFLNGGLASQGGGLSWWDKILSSISGNDENEEDDDASTNNTSLVVKINYGNTSFLFMGDAEKDLENQLMNSHIDADVLKVSHHGSDTASQFDFLQQVFSKKTILGKDKERYAVISCGKNNKHHHPHETVLESLRQLNVHLYRTDLQGMITCTSDGSRITFKPEKSTQDDLFTAPER